MTIEMQAPEFEFSEVESIEVTSQLPAEVESRPKMSKHRRRSKNLTLIDLFAGCGGLSLGLEQAGFTPVFVNELNHDALQTYLVNRLGQNPLLANPKYNVHDVKEMVLSRSYLDNLRGNLYKDFGVEDEDIDLIAGGPPCQGYSGIGHRRSYAVNKNELPSNFLYRDMATIVRRLKPRMFLFENVRGLLHSKWTEKGRTGELWDDVRETFDSIPNYRTSHALVFAKDYGVPQNRPRVLLVGVRKDVSFTPKEGSNAVEQGFLPAGTGERPPDLIDLLSDLEDPSFSNGGATARYPSPARTKVQRDLRTSRDGKTISKKGDPVLDHEYSAHSKRIVEKFAAMQRNGGEIPDKYKTKKFAQRVLPARWNGNGPTITATSLPDDYIHYSLAQPRALSVREWARLQMFPDWYRFAGKRTTGGLRRAGNPQAGLFDRELPKYTQIGNAVPVRLARRIGEHFSRILKG